MGRENFLDSLRTASRLLGTPGVTSNLGTEYDATLAGHLQNLDLWLTAKSVEGYQADDFQHWPRETREKLEKERAAFVAAVAEVPQNRSALRMRSNRARKHLEAIIQLVREPLLREWLDAQETLMAEVTDAAQAKGWHVDKDKKEIRESLLGRYLAPRLRIKTREKEVALDPVARFGSGKQGVVDLVVMPTYETAYLLTFKAGAWRIVARNGTFHSRPFSPSAFIHTITKLTPPY